MSYILDALRKADAQRERDAARGIHAQGALQSPAASSGAASGPLLWGGIAAAVLVVAGTSWFFLRGKPAEPVPAAIERPVAAVAPAPALVTPAPAPAQVMPVPAPAPMAPIVGTPPAGRTIPPRDPTNTSQPTMRRAQPVPGMIPEAPPSARAADAREAAMMRQFGGGARPNAEPVSPPAVVAAAPGAPVNGAPIASAPATARGMGQAPVAGGAPNAVAAPTGNSPAATRGGQGSAPGAGPVAAPPPIVSAPAPIATGLPPDAPKLAISGGVYSENAAQRMLIVNGQVFNEGSEIGPGIVLERVTPKGAVVKFRGGSYSVAY